MNKNTIVYSFDSDCDVWYIALPDDDTHIFQVQDLRIKLNWNWNKNTYVYDRLYLLNISPILPGVNDLNRMKNFFVFL